MPTVLRIGSTRFFFYSNEGAEPPHIHVEQGGAVAKFWLGVVSLASSTRFSAPELGGSSDRSSSIASSSFRPGMTTSEPSVDPRAVDVSVTEDELSVLLADGRRVIVPLAWFPRVLHATDEQRATWRIIGDGQGIHWPEIDEDLSVAGLLRGAAVPGVSRRAM